MDVLTRERRAEIMGLVKGKNTRPELVVRRFLHSLGFRFRLHRTDLPGRPDIVLPKWRTVIFVHGCFWHRHAGCPNTRTPKSNGRFWRAKFQSNVKRDAAARRRLRRAKWRVVVIWECETAKPAVMERKIVRAFGVGA